MTEKRYVIEEIGNMFRVLKDNEPLTTKFENCDKQDVTNLITELNELAEEKEQLEKENKKLQSINQDHCDYIGDVEADFVRLEQENKELKSILQDMGLLRSDVEVKNVRDEIASKLIKPLFKGNGFDVDVNTENGFTIIPKEVNNDRE